MDQELLTSAMESILFMSDKPVTVDRFIEVFGEDTVSTKEIQSAIDQLKEKYQAGFGFEIREAQGGYHFVTRPSNVEWIRKFLQTKPFRLGKSALEALAIIAYRQPITRAEIDQVRGIDSSHLLRTLIERGLVRMAGKAEVPGRPVQYGTTPRFLEVMGLKSVGELPPLSELEQIQGHTDDTMKPLEEGLERFVAEQRTRSEVEITGEDISGLEGIDEMIKSVRKPDSEIHESELHAEVARENEAALEGFLEFQRPYRKARAKAQLEELGSEPPAAEGETPTEPIPTEQLN